MKKSRTITEITSRDQRLAQLTRQAMALGEMDKRFRAMLPPAVAAGCNAVRISEGELLLFACNGLIAARLRMLATDLLPRLAKHGYPADRVRVQVRPAFTLPAKPKTFAISPLALEKIAQAASESVHHPVVQEALARLLANHRNR